MISAHASLSGLLAQGLDREEVRRTLNCIGKVMMNPQLRGG